MHKGVWCPKDENLTPKILILGESHYGAEGTQGQESTGLTREVIEYFLAGNIKDRWKEFFYKIAISFGYKRDIEDIANFYNRVYFGNYVDVLCDIGGENEAKKYIEENRIKYNNELFDFCNMEGIDIIICFSVLVYNNLTEIEQEKGEKDYKEVLGKIGKINNIAYKTEFKKGSRQKEYKYGLKKDLLVYGIRHPSRIYKSEQVYEFLSKELKGCSICK